MTEHRDAFARTDAVVVTAARKSERIMAAAEEHTGFITLLQHFNMNGLDLSRDCDTGRDVTLLPDGR